MRRINNVTDRESELILEHFSDLLIRNHDLQVRFKWGKNDVAIWDNRCTFHTATYKCFQICRLYLDLTMTSLESERGLSG